MSPDSISQLAQGRQMSFSDWHPPVMSLLWGLLDRIAPGPAGMLILHNIMFWGGLSLFVYGLGLSQAWSVAAIFLVGFSPPVFALLSTIWKDVGMGCSLLLACGLLLWAERTRSKLAWGAAIVLLWYGLAVRHNAIIAVFPLATWAALISHSLLSSRRDNSRSSRALRASLLVVLLVVAATSVNRLLTKTDSPRPVQQILVHDLVAVSLETNHLYLPDYLIAALSSRDVHALKPLYTPDGVVPLFCCDIGRLPIVSEPYKFSQLRAEWRSTIPRHLGAYIKHRATVYESELGIGRATVCSPYWKGIDPNPFNLEFRPNSLNQRIMRILSKVSDSPLFRGWLYLAILGVLLTLFWRSSSHDRTAGIFIGMSGLLYTAGNFFVVTTCDFRMHWWIVLATYLSALLWIAGKTNHTRLETSRRSEEVSPNPRR